ncbi:MAG: TRAP transporter large permease [Planctomycetota bacterium]|jgi:tripartite ATP-independent transporter DctM subunit
MAEDNKKLIDDKETGFIAYFKSGENLLVCIALAAMVILPVIGIILRPFETGIEGSDLFVTHLTLLVGILGSALAAREGRLLSLSTAEAFLKGWGKTLVNVFSSGVGAAISFFLMFAGILFVETTPADEILALGIPVWYVQSLLPIGFAIITLRIVWKSSEKWQWKGLTLLISLLTVGFFFYAWVDPDSPPEWMPILRDMEPEEISKWFLLEPESVLIPGVVLLVIAPLLGLPIFAMLGGAALLLFFVEDYELAASVAVDHYQVVKNATFPTIPLFTLAGYFLAEGGASERLIRLFKALFGSLRGGPAIVTVAVCAFFTSFTGASGVTILAVAALLMPVLASSGYKERDSLGLLTCAGSLGMLFPPCLPVILYAIIANQEIEMMFLGGLMPGMLAVAMVGAYGVWLAGPGKEGNHQKFDMKEALLSMKACFWELMIPVVALVGIFGGWATPVEAAAVTAFYTFIVEVFIYRDLHLTKELPHATTKCGLLVGGVLLILGVAMGFTNYLIYAEVPSNVVDWVKASIESPLAFLLCLNLLLIIVGCLMDVFSAIIVMVPLIVPLGVAFGIDPIHLGIIFLANLELGYITPPIGMNLFLSSYRFGKPMMEVCRSVLPFLLIRIIYVLLVTYIPFLTTWLPNLLR